MLPGMWLGDPRCSGCATPMPYRRRQLARHGLACRRCLRARHHAFCRHVRNSPKFVVNNTETTDLFGRDIDIAWSTCTAASSTSR